MVMVIMGILGGGGFSLPVAEAIEIVEVDLVVTEAAKIAMQTAMGDDLSTHALVISADAGGCSGYMYDMQIIPRPLGDEWQTVTIDNVAVMVHNRDSVLLNGIQIDFRDSLLGGGFQIGNPNADRACGCGKSFG
jgi:iron-sulfur cluster assembly protein